MDLEPGLRAWLLDSDPALRWQVERDLLRAPEDVWQATRARVATEGFGGRRLPPRPLRLAAPDPADGDGQPWTATTWCLHALREWGLDAACSGHRGTPRREQPLGVPGPAVPRR